MSVGSLSSGKRGSEIRDGSGGGDGEVTQARVLAVGVAPGVLWALVMDGVAVDGRSNPDGEVWSSGHGAG